MEGKGEIDAERHILAAARHTDIADIAALPDIAPVERRILARSPFKQQPVPSLDLAPGAKIAQRLCLLANPHHAGKRFDPLGHFAAIEEWLG